MPFTPPPLLDGRGSIGQTVHEQSARRSPVRRSVTSPWRVPVRRNRSWSRSLQRNRFPGRSAGSVRAAELRIVPRHRGAYRWETVQRGWGRWRPLRLGSSDHLDFGFERAGGTQILQDRDDVAWRGSYGGQRLHQLLECGALPEYDVARPLLASIDAGLRDHLRRTLGE